MPAVPHAPGRRHIPRVSSRCSQEMEAPWERDSRILLLTGRSCIALAENLCSVDVAEQAGLGRESLQALAPGLHRLGRSLLEKDERLGPLGRVFTEIARRWALGGSEASEDPVAFRLHIRRLGEVLLAIGTFPSPVWGETSRPFLEELRHLASRFGLFPAPSGAGSGTGSRLDRLLPPSATA